jgi:hypothetical protein
MRNDHVFYDRLGDVLPSHAEIERSMAEAPRLRAEAIHGYLARAVAWIRAAPRSARAPKDPVGQCC